LCSLWYILKNPDLDLRPGQDFKADKGVPGPDGIQSRRYLLAQVIDLGPGYPVSDGFGGV